MGKEVKMEDLNMIEIHVCNLKLTNKNEKNKSNWPLHKYIMQLKCLYKFHVIMFQKWNKSPSTSHYHLPICSISEGIEAWAWRGLENRKGIFVIYVSFFFFFNILMTSSSHETSGSTNIFKNLQKYENKLGLLLIWPKLPWFMIDSEYHML